MLDKMMNKVASGIAEFRLAMRVTAGEVTFDEYQEQKSRIEMLKNGEYQKLMEEA